MPLSAVLNNVPAITFFRGEMLLHRKGSAVVKPAPPLTRKAKSHIDTSESTVAILKSEVRKLNDDLIRATKQKIAAQNSNQRSAVLLVELKSTMEYVTDQLVKVETSESFAQKLDHHDSEWTFKLNQQNLHVTRLKNHIASLDDQLKNAQAATESLQLKSTLDLNEWKSKYSNLEHQFQLAYASTSTQAYKAKEGELVQVHRMNDELRATIQQCNAQISALKSNVSASSTDFKEYVTDTDSRLKELKLENAQYKTHCEVLDSRLKLALLKEEASKFDARAYHKEPLDSEGQTYLLLEQEISYTKKLDDRFANHIAQLTSEFNEII